VRALIGVLLILLGAGGAYFGVRGWTREREVVDTSILDLTVSERSNSPLVAAAGGIVLGLGIAVLLTGRGRGSS
jgi:hypothetical protein